MTRVLVAGGAGGVGSGVVASWLAHGATVLTTSRREERLDDLRRQTSDLPGRLITCATPADRDGIERLAEEHGPFDTAIASIGGGGWRLAPLAEIDEPMLRAVVEDGIVAHWRMASAVRPRIVDGGSYIFVNGGAADEVIPGTGPLSLVARAQLALSEIFDTEDRQRIRTHSLVLTSPIATPARGTNVPAHWLTPLDVGDACRALHLSTTSEREVRVSNRDQIDHIGGAAATANVSAQATARDGDRGEGPPLDSLDR